MCVLDTQPPTQLVELLHGLMVPGSCHIKRLSFVSKEFDKTEHLCSKEVFRSTVMGRQLKGKWNTARNT